MKRSGFTLIELVITITMIGVIVAAVIPPISRASRRMALDSAAQQFLGDLRRARIEAIKRNASVKVKRKGSNTNYSITFLGDRSLNGEAQFYAGPDSVVFASFGPTLTGPAEFKIKVGDGSKTIRVNASGLAKVE